MQKYDLATGVQVQVQEDESIKIIGQINGNYAQYTREAGSLAYKALRGLLDRLDFSSSFSAQMGIDKVGTVYAATQADANFVLTSMASALCLMPSFTYISEKKGPKKRISDLVQRIDGPCCGLSGQEIATELKSILTELE